jgi:hypothetical protein
MINSVASNGDKILPLTVTSFQQSRMIPHQGVLSSSRATERSDRLISTNNNSTAFTNNNTYKQLKHADQSKRW